MSTPSPMETVEDLIPWLEGRGAEELRGWLREALEENSRLRQKLCRQAQRESGMAPDLTVLKQQMIRATAPPSRGFVDWRGAGDYCDAMERACVDPLEELLNEGHALEVVELAEQVFTLTALASEHVQDSGEIGMMWDRLKVLHLEACRLAQPDGVALARRLFQHLISNQWDYFPDVIQSYQIHFGAAGLAEFRRLAEERLAALPVPAPELPEPYGGLPVRKSMAEIRRREQRALADREISYRRNRAQELLDQCGTLQDR